MKIREINNNAWSGSTSKGVLSDLTKVEFSPHNRELLKRAKSKCGGSITWRTRKYNEAFEMLALAQISNRMKVIDLDLSDDMRALVELAAPVPLNPQKTNALNTAQTVILGLTYKEEAMILPQPGYSFVQILSPHDVWHANVGPMEAGQPLCLGINLAASTPLKEILIMVYGALTLQTVQIDEKDHAGVMNAEAAKWWQDNLRYIPLTNEPFICRSRNGKESNR